MKTPKPTFAPWCLCSWCGIPTREESGFCCPMHEAKFERRYVSPQFWRVAGTDREEVKA